MNKIFNLPINVFATIKKATSKVNLFFFVSKDTNYAFIFLSLVYQSKQRNLVLFPA